MTLGSRITARELVDGRDWAPSTMTVKEMLEFFKQHPEADFVAIMHDGIIAGMVGRDHLNEKLAGKYGFSLLAGKMVTEVMVEDPLLVEANTELDQVTMHMIHARGSRKDFYNDIIVHEQGAFLGLASVKRLVIKQMERILNQVTAIEKQSEMLAQKNRELVEAGMQSGILDGQFKNLFETSSVALLIVDARSRVLQANASFQKLGGFAEGETGDGLSAADLFPSGLGNKESSVVPLRRRNGEILLVEISCNVDRDTQRIVVSVVRIVSKAEQQMQEMLTDRMAHTDGLARNVLGSLVDRNADADQMINKLESVVAYADRLEAIPSGGPAAAHARNGNEQFQLHGNIGDFSLIDLAQMLVQGQKSGELQVFEEVFRGRIYFVKGRLAHAEADEMEGIQALQELLSIRVGSFCFMFENKGNKTTIEGDPMLVLMEASAALDEAALGSVVY